MHAEDFMMVETWSPVGIPTSVRDEAGPFRIHPPRQ